MACEDARKTAVTGETDKKRAASWNRWLIFLESIELAWDPFLESIKPDDTTTLLACFAHTVRQAEYSTSSFQQLASGTVRATVDDVASTFRDHRHPDPRLDEGRKPSRLLSRLYSSYSNKDLPAKQQKAIPPSILQQLQLNTSTNRAIAISQLAIGAWFFAMRSCEYLTVFGERKTKRLCLRNLRFFREGREIKHTDRTLPSCDYVSITFEDQKNGEKNDTITMQCAYDLVLCPVRAWATIIQRIYTYPSASPDTHANAFYANGKL